MKDIIVLDTSIFIKENFLHGTKIKSLLSLSSKGIIEIYITAITYNELESKFVEHLDKAASNHQKFIKAWENCILKNSKAFDVFFKEINETSIKDEFTNNFKELINKDIIKLIPYKVIDIEPVFDCYFNSLPPFGEGKKKSEFPDAFSLELIKDFLSQNNSSAFMFSIDNDFIKCPLSNLTIRSDYDQYLDDKYKDLDKAKSDITKLLFSQNYNFLKQELIDWFKSNIDDISLYFDAVNWKEIYDLHISEVNVGDLEYKIVDIKEDYVIVEVTGDVDIEVSVLTDDEDTMYYDSDDKSYHYLEQNFECFEKKFRSKMIVTAEIISEEDYQGNFEIESINEGLEISFDISDKSNDYR
ncbi:PIN domain-containing protein [Capnocytophaga catalasegens]|nr:PIN domain-containing protein [Capnocytophaga catalasegens]